MTEVHNRLRGELPTGPTGLRLSRRAVLAALVGVATARAFDVGGGSQIALLRGAARAAELSSPALALAQEEGELKPSARMPGELAPQLTPNEAFYTVSKNAAGDPDIAPGAWRLVVDGDVGQPVQLDYNVLQQLPQVEVGKTLECISNFTAECQLVGYGCDLIGTAVWRGVSLADVLNLAGGMTSSAVSVAILGADEYSSAISPQSALDPQTILAYEMNGRPLPRLHGAPVRLLVPGRYGFKSAKWVVGIRPMTRQFLDWYGQRNWNREGIVKTMARIDVPASGTLLAAGVQGIGGVAYAGDRGIAAVELSADGGATWQAAAFIEPQLDRDAWVRWAGEFQIAAGQTTRLVVRATDGAGQLQPTDFVLPAPDGASGRHSIEVSGA